VSNHTKNLTPKTRQLQRVIIEFSSATAAAVGHTDHNHLNGHDYNQFINQLPLSRFMDINWAISSQQFDNGSWPVIAADGKTVVEVHQGGNSSGPLWYSVGSWPIVTSGQINNYNIDFPYAQQYDTGVAPAVAIDGNTVVEVHQGGEGVGPLWYRVGTVTGSQINWSDSYQYDTGVTPAVAADGNIVVEVHGRGDAARSLWYRVGTLNGPQINWSESYQYDVGGFPAVATIGNTVIEVHQGSYDAVTPLWYRAGPVTGSQINFSDSFEIPQITGARPTLATYGNTVIEVHQTVWFDQVGPLWFLLGTANEAGRISWSDSGQYDTGVTPAVATDGNTVIEVHQGGIVSASLWYNTAVLT
jgi:hypothetical protein